MRVWITLLAGVVGLVTGSLLTLWATGNEDLPRPSERRVVVPQPCLDAIDAARDRLLLNADAPELARSYATVWERVVDAARDLHVGALARSLRMFGA